MTEVNPRLRAAFDALRSANARWCLLRGRDRLARPEGDVDLLVHRADVAGARDALRAAGFATLRVWARGTQSFLLGRDSASDCWIYLHVTTETAFGAFHALRCDAAAAVLSRVTWFEGVPMPDADDRFWWTLLHGILDKGRLRDVHRMALAELGLRASTGSVLARQVARVLPEGWSIDALLGAARAERWSEIEALGPPLAARWSSADPSTARRELLHRASLLAAKVRETVTRRGVSVALLAPDGAGKSTLSESLGNALFFRVSRFYLGLEGGPFANAGRSRVPFGGIARRLVYLWRTYLRARCDQARRRFVVFDRYPYEALLPPQPGSRRLSRWRRTILGHALPRPDLVVVLDAPGDVLHRRKPEHTPERLERDRAGYRDLARRLGAVVVDAVRPPEEVRRDVIDAIWRVYVRRCGAS